MDGKTLEERSEVRACACTTFMNERVRSRKKAFKEKTDSPRLEDSF